MQIWRDVDDVPADLGRTVVSIGNFDGVHLGHAHVLREARASAARLGIDTVVAVLGEAGSEPVAAAAAAPATDSQPDGTSSPAQDTSVAADQAQPQSDQPVTDATGAATPGSASPSSSRRARMRALRPGTAVIRSALGQGTLEVGDQILRVRARHDLDQLPALLTIVVEDLLGRVDHERHRRVLPLLHADHPSVTAT